MTKALVKGVWRCFNQARVFPGASHRTIRSKVLLRVNMPRRYITSRYSCYKSGGLPQGTRSYCLFIGHARSGGSLIGALLDSHPNVVLADEVDTLHYISAGFSKDQIYHVIRGWSQKQATRGGVRAHVDGKILTYRVAGQWQGEFRELTVFGASKAGISTQRLAQNPLLFEQLKTVMAGLSAKVIHVIRNPYDAISSMNLRSGRPIANGIDRYFNNCQALVEIRRRIDRRDLITVRYNEFVASPKVWLKAVCRFLGIEATDDYVDACTSILSACPHQSRHLVVWDAGLKNTVKRKIDQFDFLEGYSFEKWASADGL